MILLVDFSPRHVFPTANWVSESCERRFGRQVGGTVPAVSPKGTSAHPFSILQRHYTFLTHFTIHDEAYFIHLCSHIDLSHRPRGTRGVHKNFTFCICILYNTILILLPRGFTLSSTRFRLFYTIKEIKCRFIW